MLAFLKLKLPTLKTSWTFCFLRFELTIVYNVKK